MTEKTPLLLAPPPTSHHSGQPAVTSWQPVTSHDVTRRHSAQPLGENVTPHYTSAPRRHSEAAAQMARRHSETLSQSRRHSETASQSRRHSGQPMTSSVMSRQGIEEDSELLQEDDSMTVPLLSKPNRTMSLSGAGV